MTRRVLELTPYKDVDPPRARRARRSPVHPATGRRLVADQARVLRHPREPHLRSGLRRHAARQRRSVADALRRGDHAERSRARPRVHAVRQLLRRRRGQLRRPRILDGCLRDRRRREAVADQLRQPRHAVPERRRVQHPRPVRQFLSAAARVHLGLMPSAPAFGAQLRRVRARGARRGGEVRADVSGTRGAGASRRIRPSISTCRINSGPTSGSRSSGRFERDGKLPRLSIIRLGNDHTSGTSPGAPTPRAMVADNDLALGRIVEAISHSRYWKESAIFVSKTTRRTGRITSTRTDRCCLRSARSRAGGSLDSTLYTTSGVLRTMELILGLPPMSQYDAAATPMYQRISARRRT